MASTVIYQDFPFDFAIHPIRKDLVLITNEDAVIRSIRHLLMTNHFETPMHPEIGCNIRKLLFEQTSEFTARDLSRFIQETIENFEPRARIQSLVVTPDEERNLYNVRLRVIVDSFSTVTTVNLILERIR
jgi:phage baseplate assembly protein W